MNITRVILVIILYPMAGTIQITGYTALLTAAREKTGRGGQTLYWATMTRELRYIMIPLAVCGSRWILAARQCFTGIQTAIRNHTLLYGGALPSRLKQMSNS